MPPGRNGVARATNDRKDYALAGLLVSVRSAEEARAAHEGGASVIDVKEPTLGPLGRASVEVWRAVRSSVPASVPVSVALGELIEWVDPPKPDAWSGLAYRKLGLAGAGPDWSGRWAAIRGRSSGPSWVAVVYSDWTRAASPSPAAILDEALAIPECVGLLVDTWDKSQPGGLDLTWAPVFERARSAGRLVALAGRLDLDAIRRLAPLRPDLFAVRGAACLGGDRLATVDRDRVAALVEAAASAPLS